jgi:hypothetical protein
MAGNFQSSFIPKEPVTAEVFKKKKAGVLGILAVSLFIFSIIVSVGAYVYKGIVRSGIENLKSQLSESEKSIDKKTIDELSDFSKKLDITKSIVLKHTVLSNFLNELASSTVSSVKFNDFDYKFADNSKTLSVLMRGEAASYATVALQESIFSKDKYFESVSFSDLALTSTGKVSFSVTLSVNPAIAVYSPKITNPPTASISNVSSSTASSTITTASSTTATASSTVKTQTKTQ